MDARRDKESDFSDIGSWKDMINESATFKDWHINRPKVNFRGVQ